MPANTSMVTAPAAEHSADWYDNDVLDARPAELLAIEYICSYYSSYIDNPENLAAGTQDDSVPRQRKTDSIWLVNERLEPILQMSRAHPMYAVLILGPLNHNNDNSHDPLPDELVIPVLEYSAERMQQMIYAVRGDMELQQASKVWWARAGNCSDRNGLV
ncbi:hypothetical protein NQ176_g3276 [Zarea fungicola]|uniref:Uncharacterized protein n=1 Tax=Zarea fungicola TaxID=93591 RepID=A0ACC1NLL8_9HYPO|nr:hypothetical protein NQ176_g3276 [Lecanicillium fungicola]